jgi:hypothetical protein
MEGPFIPRGAYQYGHTFYEQEVPYYNHTKHHACKTGRFRGLSAERVFDDGSEYTTDDTNSDGNIIRGNVPNIINVETMMVKTLKVYLYGTSEEYDQSYTLEVGKRYAITYVTEQGMKVADGYLRFLSSSIPEECTKYVGEYSDSATQGFIGVDCSTKGVSDKRKIYIATIRGIECLEDDEDYVAPSEDDSVKKYSILERLEEILNELESNGCDCCVEASEKMDEINLKLTELSNTSIYADQITSEDL